MELLLVLSCLGCCLAARPNVLVVVVEDLGWDDVSWHNPAVIMPNIGTLARQGVLLEQAYSSPSGGPAKASLLTGRYPSRTGYQFVTPNNMEPVGLPTDLKILPEYLTELGYTSHALGQWGLGFCHQDYLPTRRGFSTHYGPWASGGDHQTHIAPGEPRNTYTTLGYDFHDQESSSLAAIGYHTADLLVDRLSDVLSTHVGLEKGWFGGFPQGRVQLASPPKEDNPFMIYVNFDSMQPPLQVDQKWTDMYPYQEDPVRKTYLGMLTALDDAVGRIVNHLKRITYDDDGKDRSLFDDTVIIFTSANGGLTPQSPGAGGGSNSPLKGGKGDLLEGGTRVPAFISNLGKSGVVKDLFHISDWLPTIVQGLAGGSESSLQNLDGINQLDVLRGLSMPLRTEVLYDVANFLGVTYNHSSPSPAPEDYQLTGATGAALRVKGLKIVKGCSTLASCARNYNSTWEGAASSNRTLLYDLSKDPEEQEDLSQEASFQEDLEELEKRLSHHLARALPPLHTASDSSGTPIYSFPLIPAQFFTSWCEAKTLPQTRK